MYSLENGVQWDNNLKNAFKHNVTRAKLLWSGEEINEDNYLKDVTLDEQYYIQNYGFVGAATARKLEINLIEGSTDLNLENAEINYKLGADIKAKNKFDYTMDCTQKSNIVKTFTLPTGKKILQTDNGNWRFGTYVLLDLSKYVDKTIRAKANFTASGTNKGRFYIGTSSINGYNRTAKGVATSSGQTVSFVVPQFEDENKYLALVLYSNSDGTAVANDYVEYTNIIVTIDNDDMTYEKGYFSTNYINYGNFIVNKPPENDETNGTIRLVAYDYMIKFNKPYEDRVTYPCTLLTLLQDVCSQAGVTLGSTNFANKDFVVEDNQFEGFTLREVLQNIAKCAFSWARIGQDNKLYLDFSTTPATTETITIDDYKANCFKKANEYYGPINQVTYADSDIEGQEEKVPSTPPVGDLKELVIYDNLFAYTPEKRSELIQAGTMLLGLTYMPISQLELIGLAYLDCRDAISIGTLAEETFTSRVFSHKIVYNGTSHDSIVTEGTSGNEEAYKNTATNVFQNQQTRIKVDRANKNISLLVQDVDEQNERISDLEITTEGIEAQVSNIYSATKHVLGTRQITLENCVQGYLVKLRIKGNNNVFDYLYPADDLYPSDTLYPRGDSRIVVTNANNESTVYELRVNEVLRANDEVYDEYILEDNFAKVIRRVNPDGTTKTTEVVENIGTYTIYVDDGNNTIRIQNYSAPIEAIYVEKNSYTNQFATTIEMNSSIELAEQEINIEVSKKVDNEDFTGANIMLKINEDESQAVINADKISLEGKTIDLTGEDITIDSDNFKVDAEGNVTCNSLELTGGSIALDINDTGGVEYFELKAPLHESRVDFSGRNIEMWSDYSMHRMIDIGVFSNQAQGYIECQGQIDCVDLVCNDLQVYGSKNRIVEIDNGNKVLLNAYETPTPYFGDIGSSRTNENGICEIDIEEIFSQTIELENYKVFIQKCGEGDLYVKKYDKYFMVIGTPNLDFDWEIKAIQKGYSNIRLKKFERGGK